MIKDAFVLSFSKLKKKNLIIFSKIYFTIAFEICIRAAYELYSNYYIRTIFENYIITFFGTF